MRIPIYIKDKKFTPPQNEPIYYLITGDGLFKAHNMPLFSSISLVEDGVPGLEPQEEQLDLRLPKIPKSLIERAVGFFDEVYEKYRSEAILLIQYHPVKHCYRFVAPPQTITLYVYPWYTVPKNEVEYEVVAPPRGFRHIGSIHSHGSMPAFQSWQDAEDQRHKDGLHLVVGSLTWGIDFNAAFWIGGRRFELELTDVAEGFDAPIKPAPRVWWKQITCKKVTLGGYGWGGSAYDDCGSSSSGCPSGHDGFGKLPD